MSRYKSVMLRLLFAGLRGAVSGLGIGVFFFLRLGFPKDLETAGFVSGLFCVAGVKFGITVEVLRHLVRAIGKGTRFGQNAGPGVPSSPSEMEVQSRPDGQIRSRHTLCRRPGNNEGAMAHASGVTVVIPVLNEASRVANAILPLRWADEVIVVDGGSTDATVELARHAGATVLSSAGACIGAQRNAGIAAARNPWVLALDVDEFVPDALSAEILSVTQNPKHDAYRVRLRNFYLGAELRHGSWGRDWHTRLFRRELRFVERRVHESLQFVACVGTLRSCLEHTPYRDFEHHCSKMLRYAYWGAQDLHDQGRSPRASDIALVPFCRFFREYFLFQGWRDGSRGLVCAALDAVSTLLKYANLFALHWLGESRNDGKTTHGMNKRLPRKDERSTILC
jgi:glycosyltransferase involved in cell wall biosynthesis